MEPHELSMVFRGIERLIVSAGAMACIILGFRLFATVLSDRSSFEGAISGFSIKAQRVAPGLIFAAFGAFLLYASINSQIEFDDGLVMQSSPPIGQTQTQTSLTGLEIRSLSRAILLLEDEEAANGIDQIDRSVLIGNLKNLRDAQMHQRYSLTQIAAAKLATGPTNDGISENIRTLLGLK